MAIEPKTPQGKLEQGASFVDTRSDQELAEDGISMDTRTDEEILRSLGMEMGRFDGSDEPPEPEIDENAPDAEGLVEEFVDRFFKSLGEPEEQSAPDEDTGTDEELLGMELGRDPEDPHHLVCSFRPRVVIFDESCTKEEIRSALGLEPGEPLGIDLNGSVDEVCAAVDIRLAKKHGG